MKVGKYTYGHTKINHISLRGGRIEIGKFCSIAKNCKIYTGKGGHRKEWVSVYPFGVLHKDIFNGDCNISKRYIQNIDPGDVIIENDVWIGQNVTIMPGVFIGSGSIIANNSHVVKNCPAYSIIDGNPAKIIKKRFSESQIEKLLEIKWWDWDNDKINRNLALITNSDIDRFINNYK